MFKLVFINFFIENATGPKSIPLSNNGKFSDNSISHKRPLSGLYANEISPAHHLITDKRWILEEIWRKRFSMKTFGKPFKMHIFLQEISWKYMILTNQWFSLKNLYRSGWEKLVFRWYMLKSARIEHLFETFWKQMTFYLNWRYCHWQPLTTIDSHCLW